MRRARAPTLPLWAEVALLPLVNVALAFVTVGIIVRLIGVDPLQALRLLVVGAAGSSESIGYTLYYATNFIFTGLPWLSPSMPACSTSAARARPISAGWAAAW